MDIAKIRSEIETLLKEQPAEIDWKSVVGQARDIVSQHAPGVNDFNIKIGKDIGNKFNVELVIPMVFKF